MRRLFTLNFLRIIALIVIVPGVIGSLCFMFNAGRNQKSIILISLFTAWVLSPFVGLLIANKISIKWEHVTRVALYWLMLILTFGSLVSYSGALSPFGTKAAFKFLVVPLISWLLILSVLPIVSRMSRKNNDM
jgi:hypothetical protein